MRTVDINGHKVEVHDSIDELSVRRFQKYNKYLLIDSGIGSDLQDIIDRIERTKVYVKNSPGRAITELENMKQGIYLMTEGISPEHMAFATLVRSIDGEATDDLSDEGLRRVIDRLADAKKTIIDRVLNSVKKKIDTELSLYFPGKFENGALKEYYDQLKAHTMLRVRHIRTGEDVSDKLQEIEERLAMLMKPKVFSGSKSAEIAYDKQFEEMCLILSQHINVNPNEMTVLQFYNAFEHLKKEAKEKAKAARRMKKHK